MPPAQMKAYTLEYETTDGKKGRVTVHGYSLRDAVLTALDHHAGVRSLPNNLSRVEVTS
jgi:hypothetical protein